MTNKKNIREEISSAAEELVLYADNNYDVYQFALNNPDKEEVFEYALKQYEKDLGELDYDDHEKLKYEFMSRFGRNLEEESYEPRTKLENYIRNGLQKIKEQEESHPGLQKTKSVQDEEKDTNEDYYGDIKKKMKDYAKNTGGDTDEDYTLEDPPKKEPSESEQEYIEDMERSRGLQHFEYDNEPDDKFKERAQKAIEGDSTMGNKTYTGEENGNTEPTWGASKEDFGKELVKQTNRRKKRTDDAKLNVTSFGDDIEMSDKDKINRSNAFGESKKSNKKAIKETKKDNKMKRLKFKKNFNGMDNALELIPEHYKVDGKKFEMTDGNETYRIRWESDQLTEGEGEDKGRPVVLESKNNEDLQKDSNRVKELMNFDPQDNFGNLKGKQKVEENERFNDIWDKSKKIMTESEEIKDEDRIGSLNGVEDKLKKKHIPKLAEKPLYEVASSMANKRLSKYDTKFDDINEAYDLKNKIKEGMTYEQLNYLIEEGIKEAARLSLIKEDIKKPTTSKEESEYSYKTVSDHRKKKVTEQ